VRLATIQSREERVAVVLREANAVTIRRPDFTSYRDIRELLEAGSDGMVDARRALDDGIEVEAGWRFLRPVTDPGATWCVGRNYRAHSLEAGREPPPAPVWFGKFPATLTDPEADVVMPAVDEAIDYEGELAVVIGHPTSAISADEAWAAVAGVTLFNDVSARTLGRVRQNVFFGKNLQRSSALGPVLVTGDEIGDFGALTFELHVNGARRQLGHASDLLFDVPTLIADLASITTLLPGDVIATGTPAGVGMGFDPPRWLKPGDVVEVSCAPIGRLRNRFV
jgi:2-keto-4-pentenoate hydratase/2-oxohepta-3-ene-1,7-dioic acid hydratase in catechol pathway